ncbi:hypothetical protein KIN_25740 [Litoreibacter roseus]|uniref:Uncharacterized protein n=1 Tax=Litoreibacter roseus TaxID=2601869 RepID=A0A6N6JI57_9RHOB|nr:hypothetical protein KIN_25740 [Litoreibacter roseus]
MRSSASVGMGSKRTCGDAAEPKLLEMTEVRDKVSFRCDCANVGFHLVAKMVCSAPNLWSLSISTIPCDFNKRQDAELAL